MSVETHLSGRVLRRWLAFRNRVQVLQRHECTLHVLDGAVCVKDIFQPVFKLLGKKVSEKIFCVGRKKNEKMNTLSFLLFIDYFLFFPGTPLFSFFI